MKKLTTVLIIKLVLDWLLNDYNQNQVFRKLRFTLFRLLLSDYSNRSCSIVILFFVLLISSFAGIRNQGNFDANAFGVLGT